MLGLSPMPGRGCWLTWRSGTTSTGQLSVGLAGLTRPRTAHDPGRVLVDLAVAVADGAECILGPLPDNPHRLGKPLRGRYEGQHSARCGAHHRVRYEIDDAAGLVTVLDISRRADTYGTD